MKKILIILSFLILSVNTYAQEDDSEYLKNAEKQLEILNNCLNNPDCYICRDEITDNFYNCEERSPYSASLKTTNKGIKNQFCLNPNTKMICQKEGDNYTCPLGNFDCLDNGNGIYECSASQCIASSEIDVTPPEKDVYINPTQSDTYEKQEGEVCDLDKVKLFGGTLYTCRERDKNTISSVGNNCCQDIGSGKYNLNTELTNALTDDLIETSLNVLKESATYKLIATHIASPTMAVTGATAALAAIGDLLVKWNLLSANPVTEMIGGVIDMFTGGDCDNNEEILQILRKSYNTSDNDGNCIYLGKYCQMYYSGCNKIGNWDWSIRGCRRHAQIYCCYPNILDKAFSKAAKDQLKKSFGSYPISVGRNPCKPDREKIHVDCSGITIEEMSKLNLNSPGFNADINDFVQSKMNETMPDINQMRDTQDYEKMSQDILNSYK